LIEEIAKRPCLGTAEIRRADLATTGLAGFASATMGAAKCGERQATKDGGAGMLRYRVAFDLERGHFVLPALSEMIRPEETFSSRAAAQKIARGKNAQPADLPGNVPPMPVGQRGPLPKTLRRTSA
jgi:hypothetical protein